GGARAGGRSAGPERRDFLGFGRRERLDLRRLLLGTGQVGLALVGLDRDRQLALRDRRLLAGARLGLAELALLDRCRLLPAVGLDLLERDLARSELGQDVLEARPAATLCRGADQDF